MALPTGEVDSPAAASAYYTRNGLSGRAARGSVDPRKMACLPRCSCVSRFKAIDARIVALILRFAYSHDTKHLPRPAAQKSIGHAALNQVVGGHPRSPRSRGNRPGRRKKRLSPFTLTPPAIIVIGLSSPEGQS
jgi:hypothetical protein